jgi:hypothetical protein
MAIPPIRNHGESGHLQDHNDLRNTLSTHDSYLDQPVTTSSSPTFQSVSYTHAQSKSSTINLTTNLITTVDSFPVSTFRSAEYNIQLNQESKFTTVKAVVVHNNSDSGICEYGKIELGGSISYTLSSDVIDSNCTLRLIGPDADVNNIIVKIYKTMISI